MTAPKILLFALGFMFTALCGLAQPNVRWWKGNLHTHTLWSDGDDFPEMVVDWYKSRGYDFLALSDHNKLQEGEAWVVSTNRIVAAALPRYIRRFGTNWVEQGTRKGAPVVRLKTFSEFRDQFEAPGRFLLIQAEEVTDKFGPWHIHMIASNIREYIKPQGGISAVDVMQRNIDALIEQRNRLGVPMIIHLAHPNFHYSVTAEDMIQLRGERFFEVYNGHPQVNNEGDASRASTERMWDIVNTHRIAERRDLPLLGVAVDDAHHYSKFSPSNSNAGRGWVMVKAPQLNTEAIIGALENGDFYASTGVELSELTWKENRLSLRIAPEPGVTYTTQFVGSRRPLNWNSQAVTNSQGHALAVTRQYHSSMGAVLSEQRGTNVSFTCTGDELYVRARVISSKIKVNGLKADEREMAWTQPVSPLRKP